MRDIVIRRGIVKVVGDFQRAARLDDRSFERVFAAGGGPPAAVGRDRDGPPPRPGHHALGARAGDPRARPPTAGTA